MEALNFPEQLNQVGKKDEWLEKVEFSGF